MLLDNAPSHPKKEELNLIDEQVQVDYLPSNVTPIIQPMDQGDISALKRNYKTSYLRELLAHELQDIASVNKFILKWSLFDVALC